MDAIKSKMKKLSAETEVATAKANRFEEEGHRGITEAGKIEHNLSTLMKKNQAQ